ncbi:6-carboxyhexanoate--CoA ligase [Corynebacterium epidermidicanis]|uniref:6-carboxyhexanoate--CoA ligase n=1 Tax=Corynebacterium epidermidicanis TaxID=1050174 RepID=A0A0G3GVY1_9CORY|nr:6-carboxyhexanoate--CoA ligase [Corynebacterium epidermidicanis]AKK03663.1 Pimeloyl-CoA synthetase [Corynebacterium epidermidicanis]
MAEQLFSVRMRASQAGRHISGAERICTFEHVPQVSAQLHRRALTHPNGTPDSIHITTEALRQVTHVPALQVRELDPTVPASIHFAKLFDAHGWHPSALDHLYSVTGLRGAMIVDAWTGRRLDPHFERGVRASTMDAAGLSHSPDAKDHATEALVLAAKVAAAPGILAELCISDDPDYTTGYLACDGIYHRIFHCKEPGSSIGTRVFLFDSQLAALPDTIEFLEHHPVLVEGIYS